MRDFKFRYFNGAAKLMYPSEFYAIDLDGNFLQAMPLPPGYEDREGYRLFVPFELHDGDVMMQYTGYKDEKGVEIYEDDLISVHGYAGRIVFVDGAWCKVEYRSYDKKGQRHKIIPLSNLKTGLRVIGNIHENMEAAL